MHSKHVISMTIANEPGELARVAGAFSGRGFNIDSLCVAQTLDPRMCCITLVTEGGKRQIEQVVRQLGRLIRVRTVTQVEPESGVQHELALIRLCPLTQSMREELASLLRDFVANVVEDSTNELIIEVVAAAGAIDQLLEQLKLLGVRAMVRTGVLCLSSSCDPVEVLPDTKSQERGMS